MKQEEVFTLRVSLMLTVPYFTGYDGVHGWQLWKSDGTTTGTIMVTDINLSGEGLVPSEMTDVNGVLYFVPHDGVHGYDQIWKSDGTAAGTVMIADINPSPTGAAYIMNLTYVNGILYFSGNDAVHGSQLWKSDGTAEGTALVSNISPAYGAFTFDSLTSFNGTIYFFGRHRVRENSFGRAMGQRREPFWSRMSVDMGFGALSMLTIPSTSMPMTITDGNFGRVTGLQRGP